jgi:hypothetical protein
MGSEISPGTGEISGRAQSRDFFFSLLARGNFRKRVRPCAESAESMLTFVNRAAASNVFSIENVWLAAG